MPDVDVYVYATPAGQAFIDMVEWPVFKSKLQQIVVNAINIWATHPLKTATAPEPALEKAPSRVPVYEPAFYNPGIDEDTADIIVFVQPHVTPRRRRFKKRIHESIIKDLEVWLALIDVCKGLDGQPLVEVSFNLIEGWWGRTKPKNRFVHPED